MSSNEPSHPEAPPSENNEARAASPASEVSPISPASQVAADAFGARPALISAEKFRPPAPGSVKFELVASSAPPPKLRADAPRAAPTAVQAQPVVAPADELVDFFGQGGSQAWPQAGSNYLASRAPASDPLALRRTRVPVLLALGIVFAGWAILLLTAGEDNALPDLFPKWLPGALGVFALIFIALGLINALSLHAEIYGSGAAKKKD